MAQSIKLKTNIPGPKSLALMERRQRLVARGPFHTTPVFADRGEGALLIDVDGNQFLDFACGIGVTNVGHAPSAVVDRVVAQAKKILHPGFNVAPYEAYIQVAEKLAEHTPGKFPKKTLLVNSGAEAVENAIKIARAFTKRRTILCFEHGFHGRTYMAMTLTAKSKPYKFGFGPFCPDVYAVPFPNPYRWQGANGDSTRTSDECFSLIETLLSTQIPAEEVAAFILEPVQGEGGFHVFPKDFLAKLQAFCRKNGILIIADEIQSGFGRTGDWFASPQLGLEPDLITMAKGLAGGLPLAAVTGRAEVMDGPDIGGVGGTYGGNPVACAAALGVFEMLEKGGVLENAKKIGKQLDRRLSSWKEKFPIIGDARGLGPMRAIELVKDQKTKEANKDGAKKLTEYAYKNGVLLLSAGTFGNVIRFLVPLVITPEQLDEGLDVVEKGLAN